MDHECVCHELARARCCWCVSIISRLKRSARLTRSGLWRHPENRSQQYNDINYWIDLAKILEEGKFHGLFIADMLGIYDVYKGPENIDPVLPGAAQFPISDPLLESSRI